MKPLLSVPLGLLLCSLTTLTAKKAMPSNVLGAYPMPVGSGADEAVLSTHADSEAKQELVAAMIAKYHLAGEHPSSAAPTPAPALILPGGLTAAQWDEHAAMVGAGRRVVAPTPFPSRAPTAVPAHKPGRHTASFGDFKYVGGRVVLICPAGARRAATSHVLMGHADLGRCEQCAGGRFQPREDAVVCPACPVGKYSMHHGNVACTACAAGRFQPHAGMTFCYDSRLRGEPGNMTFYSFKHQTFDASGRVTGQVGKAHYSPSGALACCAAKCPELTLTAAERRNPLWLVKNRAWRYGEAYFIAPTATTAHADCDTGCRMWMRHSSLNWEGSHWRLGLLDRCSRDCEQAELTQHHAWTTAHKGVASKGACMAGCKNYFDCMFEQDAVFAELPSMLQP